MLDIVLDNGSMEIRKTDKVPAFSDLYLNREERKFGSEDPKKGFFPEGCRKRNCFFYFENCSV